MEKIEDRDYYYYTFKKLYVSTIDSRDVVSSNFGVGREFVVKYRNGLSDYRIVCFGLYPGNKDLFIIRIYSLDKVLPLLKYPLLYDAIENKIVNLDTLKEVLCFFDDEADNIELDILVQGFSKMITDVISRHVRSIKAIGIWNYLF